MADDHDPEIPGPLGQLIRDWSALRPDIEGVAFSTMIHIGHLSMLLGRMVEDIAAGSGLSQSDVRLLMAIKRDQHGKPVRPSDLGDRLGLSRATITYRVDRLLDLGLAERFTDPEDRRSLFVKLTGKGEAAVEEIMSQYAARSERLLAEVDRLPGGRKALEARLRAVAAAFAAGAGAADPPAAGKVSGREPR